MKQFPMHTLEIQDQTKWLVLRMIYVKDSDPTTGQSLVGLDFLGTHLF